jgi:hypothetical protein
LINGLPKSISNDYLKSITNSDRWLAPSRIFKTPVSSDVFRRTLSATTQRPELAPPSFSLTISDGAAAKAAP